MLSFRDVDYLLALEEHRSFQKAADTCHVSQPALSMQIKKIEDVLGVQIFERAGRQLHITPSGRTLLDQAARIQEEAADLFAMAEASKNPLEGRVRIGVIPTLGPYLWPHLLDPLEKALPQVEWYLYELRTEDVVAALEEGRIDMGLLALPVEGKALWQEELFEEPFTLCVSQDHDYAKRSFMDVSEIDLEQMILLEEGHCLRDQALEVCSMDKGISTYQATSLETLRQMVAARHGLTLMPALAATEMPKISYVPFKRPIPTRQIGLVCRRSYPKPEIFEKTAGLIRTQAAGFLNSMKTAA